MKVCFECNTKFESMEWKCPSCHNTPQQISGFMAFSPELAKSNDGFKSEFFAKLSVLEENNFWFCSRNRLITWFLHRYFPMVKSFFEIGCGTGFVLQGIKKEFPQLALYGSEIFSGGLSFAAKRLERVELFQMDARTIPFEKEFDVIGSFDVLEHIEDDEVVLAQMYRASREGGGIILTVPQHRFLWSEVDEYACHVRRYTMIELKNKVKKAGFEILRITSFVSLLFPLMMLSRLKSKRIKDKSAVWDEFKITKGTNKLLEKVLDIERLIIRSGKNLPFGGSLILVARKV